MKILRVALDVPVDRLFDYQSAEAHPSDVGRRVLVPFGKRTAVGLIVEIVEHSDVPPDRLKVALRILRDVPALGANDLDLLAFAAAYYQHPLGATVLSALPKRLRRPQTIRRPRKAFGLTPLGATQADSQIPAHAVVKRKLLTLLRARPCVDVEAVRSLGRTAMATAKQWIAQGWVSVQELPPLQQPVARNGCDTVSSSPPLTPEQLRAAKAIEAHLGQFKPFVLLGVTGSGKTEVYLHAMQQVLGAGRQVLLLVPEIALTPQLEGTIRTRFPATPLVTLHSRLSETERLQNWLSAQAGAARIVLGTRLAVFAPMPELGLIVVDEEHDPSFKQEEGLRYSARDIAVVRAQRANIPVVLGSATPALETYHRTLSGRYELLTLSQRIGTAPPRIELVDTRRSALTEGISARLLEALAARLERREQSLVFINRRGFAPVLVCRACGWLSGCHRCSANLVLHLHDRSLRCHHCGHHGALPKTCPNCGNPDIGPVGHGTQRIELALQRHFPEARILRIDRDSTRARHAWSTMRRQIEEREVDILVGTQILAKGHDFVHLSLVGVINADSLLYNTDVRASERLYALLSQVAGRAGRAAIRGEVLIQTDFPTHPLYEALRAQDYPAFARRLLDERKQAGFPPFVHQALLRAEAASMETALEYLHHAARVGRRLSSEITIYDPVPATMPRLAGRERAQLLTQSDSRPRLQRFLAAWQARLSEERSTRARWSLDVDPLEF